MEPTTGAAPVWSRLQDECMAALPSRHEVAEAGGHAPHALLRRTIRFRGGPGALVRFSFQCEIGESPRCCPVLRGLRDRCIAAMLATQDGSQWTCSTTCGCRSVRFPTGGGALVRFDFHEIGGPGWIRAINLPGQSRALSLFELQGNTIRQPELHRSLADTSGVRRFQRFGGIEMVGHLGAAPSICRSGGYADSAPRARTSATSRMPRVNGGATGNRTPIYAMPLRRLALGRWPRNRARARIAAPAAMQLQRSAFADCATAQCVRTG